MRSMNSSSVLCPTTIIIELSVCILNDISHCANEIEFKVALITSNATSCCLFIKMRAFLGSCHFFCALNCIRSFIYSFQILFIVTLVIAYFQHLPGLKPETLEHLPITMSLENLLMGLDVLNLKRQKQHFWLHGQSEDISSNLFQP